MGGCFCERGDEVVAVRVDEGTGGGSDREDGARGAGEGDVGGGTRAVEGGKGLVSDGSGKVKEVVWGCHGDWRVSSMKMVYEE